MVFGVCECSRRSIWQFPKNQVSPAPHIGGFLELSSLRRKRQFPEASKPLTLSPKPQTGHGGLRSRQKLEGLLLQIATLNSRFHVLFHYPYITPYILLLNIHGWFGPKYGLSVEQAKGPF